LANFLSKISGKYFQNDNIDPRFALTSFIIPLLALSFYYARICVRIRQNLRSKELDKGSI
jgi:hypothetical protein